MKGKALLTMVAAAFVALMVASTAVADHQSGYQLTIKAPSAAQVGGKVAVSGQLTQLRNYAAVSNSNHDGSVGVPSTRVKLFTSTSPSCNKGQEMVANGFTDDHGFYSLAFTPDTAGPLWVQTMAYIDGRGIDSPCLSLSITTLPVGPSHDSGSFLCYSAGGDLFYAPDEETAESLLAAGYWLPTAVPGVEKDGTNIGSTNSDHSQYHLVCKAPGAPADKYTNHEGDQLSGDFATGTGSSDGFYPIG